MNDFIKNELAELEENNARESFKVYDLESATWAFSKLAALYTKKSEIEDVADNEIKRIEAWENQEKQSLDSSIAYFENLLTDYYREEKAKDKRYKLSTPYGKVTQRAGKDYTYNEEVLLKELEGTDYIIRTEKIDKKKLKEDVTLLEDGRAVMEDGTILEGFTAPDKITYTVKSII